jgi:hypothetical protein
MIRCPSGSEVVEDIAGTKYAIGKEVLLYDIIQQSSDQGVFRNDLSELIFCCIFQRGTVL